MNEIKEAIYFVPNKIFPNEVWKKIDDKYIKGIKDTYLISSYGRVYNWRTEKFLTPIDNSNHLSVHLRSIGNDNKSIDNNANIQRIMMTTFNCIDNFNNYDVDHIDNCSYNNIIDNLQWLTREENIKKEYNFLNGRKAISVNRGMDSHFAKLDDNTVNHICKLLSETNLNYNDIADRFNNVTEYDVSNIKNRKTWNHISKNYTWNHREKREIKYECN